MHCFVFLSLLSHYSTAVFTRVPFFDRKAKGVKGLGPFSDLWWWEKLHVLLLCHLKAFISFGTVSSTLGKVLIYGHLLGQVPSHIAQAHHSKAFKIK